MFTEESSWRPKLNNLHFDKINDLATSQLEIEFFEVEIFDYLKDYEGDKALGSYSFNMNFFKCFGVLSRMILWNSSRIFARILHSSNLLIPLLWC